MQMQNESRRQMNSVAEWQNGIAELSPMTDPCPGFRAGQWPGVYAAAADAGWGTLELFGVHPVLVGGTVRVKARI